MLSQRIVGRLSLYRRLIGDLLAEDATHVFSHELANLAGVSAAQVRRDMMDLGFTGTPRRGYEVEGLATSIGRFLDPEMVQNVALVGVGNLGRAIMAFFAERRPALKIAVAFDADPAKTDRTYHGVRCYPIAALAQQIADYRITVAVIAVPAPVAKGIADRLVAAGVRGILNFAPVPLHVPDGVYVEQIDMTMALEKVAFFARLR